jgi:hypothetical protein
VAILGGGVGIRNISTFVITFRCVNMVLVVDRLNASTSISIDPRVCVSDDVLIIKHD